ncbi:MAG: Hint domain-containing protein [Pseudomonadota bacterium]
MADFGYTTFFTYNSAGVNQGGVEFPGTASDGENTGVGSGTFEVGDEWNNADYRGQLTFDGELVPVFENRTDGSFFIISIRALADITAPSNLTLPPTDTGPFTVCFAAGTRIATPNGEQAVETLAIGDTVLSASGSHIAVTWVGRQTLRKLWLGDRMQPVRIRAGALGNGLPHSDLTVTADHGMVFPSSSGAVGENTNDGYVINAAALVNHDTIDFVPMDELEDTFTVYHIETEAHDVILANGAPSETFIDAAGRSAFDNYQEYLDLYGAERIIPENPMPRIAAARLVPQAIKDRLLMQPSVIRAA